MIDSLKLNLSKLWNFKLKLRKNKIIYLGYKTFFWREDKRSKNPTRQPNK
jgi:hypothetical protein